MSSGHSSLTLAELKAQLGRLASKEKATVLQRFFKTGKGQYGEGDVFLGITVPQLRALARQAIDLRLAQCSSLISSKIHEHRSIALFIIVLKYKNPKDEQERKRLFDWYIAHKAHINNWDLVDGSAPYLVGDFLLDKPASQRKVLYSLMRSKNMWNRRIALIATLTFIRHGQFHDTLCLVEMNLSDREDLMHKAAGWMLREIGKKDVSVLEHFLKKHYPKLVRTTLRYAIERFEERKRKAYLQGIF